MPLTRRVIILRLAILIALGASTLLTVDSLREGPAFCPLEKACATARESDLGSFGGVGTSVLGLGAFFTLMLLTMPPPHLTRYLLAPAGALACGVGTCLLLHQGFVLGSFCPLCVVADSAGIVAGLLILGWSTPVYESHWAESESMAHKSAWTLAATLVVVLPFAIRNTEAAPAWEEITPLSADELAFAEEPDLAPAAVVADVPHLPPPLALALEDDLPPPPASPVPEAPPPEVLTPEPEQPEPDDVPAPSEPVVEVASLPLSIDVTDRSLTTSMAPSVEKTTEPAPVSEPDVVIVEYLNAYCKHCRKTHRRLDNVLSATDATVKRRRVYTWNSDEFPLWARALAYAQTIDLEDELFAELVRSRSDRRSEVFAAAQRAGIDTWALKRALADSALPMRLVKDRALATKAKLQGLPTLDIGRRRLMGEQTEATLRAALNAALGR